MGTNRTDIWREHIEKLWDHGGSTGTYWNTVHGLAHRRPLQQDSSSIAFRDGGNNSSAGPNGIGIRHLGDMGGNGLWCLTDINNAAINDKIPHVWKLANIIPIPKPNGDVSIGTSYRPISLLSVIAETLGKLILTYITRNMPGSMARVQGQMLHRHTAAQHQQHCHDRFRPTHSTRAHHRSSIRHE